MIEIEVNKDNLEKFINNLRLEDKEELIDALGKNYKAKFIEKTLNIKGIYFLADKNKTPVAIGGVLETLNPDKKIGIVWLLVTKDVDKHKKFLYKYVKNKIVLFQKEFDILFNYIYKTNFNALKWLKKCDFIEKNTSRDDYKLFYFDKGENNFDIRNITCK